MTPCMTQVHAYHLTSASEKHGMSAAEWAAVERLDALGLLKS